MELIFNMFKTKYEILEKRYPKINIVNEEQYKRSEKIKILINLNDILTTALIYSTNKKIKLHKTQIFEEVMNICAHYKRFFKKSNWLLSNAVKKKIEIYLYYSIEKYEPFIKSYNSLYNILLQSSGDDYLVDTIFSALTLLTQVLRYIPGVYIVDSKTIPLWYIPFYITHKSDNDSAILIISNNPLDYSIIPMSNLDISTWKPRKENINTNINFWFNMNIFPDDNINPKIVMKHYPKLLALVGIKNLDMTPALKSPIKKKFIKIINDEHVDTIFDCNDLSYFDLTSDEKDKYFTRYEVTNVVQYYSNFLYKLNADEAKWKEDLYLNSIENDIKYISQNVHVYDLL